MNYIDRTKIQEVPIQPEIIMLDMGTVSRVGLGRKIQAVIDADQVQERQLQERLSLRRLK